MSPSSTEKGRGAAEDGMTAGIEVAAKFVQKRLDDYVNEHGFYDHTTGMTEFPGNGEEYVGELEEIIEGIRALRPATKPPSYWGRIVKRLLNPPFGTDTSERLLMGEAADAIRYLLERVDPACVALKAEVAAWRECALYDPTMEGPRFKGWDRSALERCRLAAEKARATGESSK